MTVRYWWFRICARNL